ncbi:MAG: toll/interleukin-1 receptor domain-containing protein [Gammaproteobacteria bacterium]|nr:toll/interleukin-1 receptor domain-containing protein [Gammaproteobacteria bacterium]
MAKKIFLSYRREDRPGYVARLKDELERTFGKGRVFRDVEDIAGGSKWKEVLEHNLQASGVVLVIIGPHWESIWAARVGDSVNYVAFELERARELGVPVIPVTLDGTVLSNKIDLGEITWLLDNQCYDISDKQGRWGADVKGLMALIEALPGMGAVRDEQAPKPVPDGIASTRGLVKKAGWAAVTLVGALVLVLALQEPQLDEPTGNDPVSEQRWAGPGAVNVDVTSQIGTPGESPGLAPDYPDITGTWQSSSDGTVYHVVQYDGGHFAINSPGYAAGSGRFLPQQPHQFQVTLTGVGQGLFSVSPDGTTIEGWFTETATGLRQHDTLTLLD